MAWYPRVFGALKTVRPVIWGITVGPIALFVAFVAFMSTVGPHNPTRVVEVRVSNDATTACDLSLGHVGNPARRAAGRVRAGETLVLQTKPGLSDQRLFASCGGGEFWVESAGLLEDCSIETFVVRIKEDPSRYFFVPGVRTRKPCGPDADLLE